MNRDFKHKLYHFILVTGLLTSLVLGGFSLNWQADSFLPGLILNHAQADSIEYHVARRVAEESKIVAGWSEVTLTPSDGIAGSNFTVGEEYLIFCWGAHNNSNNGSYTGMRLKHGSTVFSESQTIEECDRTNAQYKTYYFWFTVWTAANEDIKVEYYGDNTNTTRVEDITLVAINLEDLIADGDFEYDIQTGGGTLTTTPTSKASITWTPANDGDTWWIMSYMQTDIQTTAAYFQGRLNIDSSPLTTHSVQAEDTANTTTKGIGWAQTFDDTSHTVSLELSQSAASQDWLAAGVFALRLNVFEVFAIDTAAGIGSVMDVDEAWVTDQVTVGPTVSTQGDWLIAGGALVDDNNARVHTRMQLGDGSITDETGGWQHNAADVRAATLCDFYSNLTTGTKDIDLDSEITAAGSANLYDAWLVAFSMELPTATIDISGTVYTNESKTLNIGENKTVALSVNGATVQTDETDTNGQFDFTAVVVNPNDVLLLYVDGETENGSLITIIDGLTGFTGGNALEMVTEKVILEYQTGTAITNTNLDVIDAVDAQNEDGVAISGANVTFADGFEVWVDSGMTYTPGGTVEADGFEIDATAVFNAAAFAVTVSGDFTISATGTLTSTGTVTFDGSSKQVLSTGGIDAAHDFQNITHFGSGELELDSSYDLDVDGTFSQSGTGDFDTQAKTITANALGVSNGTFNNDARAGTWNIGSGDITISGGTLTATSGTFNITGSFSNSGTFDANSATATFNATGGTPTIDASVANGAFNNLTIDANGITYTLSSAIDIDSALDVTDGTLNADSNDINIGGAWTVHATNGAFTSGTNTVYFDGSSTQILTPGGIDVNHDFQNLDHSGAGTLQLAIGGDLDVDDTITQSGSGDFDTQGENITADALTVSGGTFNTSADSGTWDIDDGGLTVSAGTLTATLGTFNIEGSFSNSGTFTHNSSNIIFDAAGGTPSINAPVANGVFYDITFDCSGITYTLSSTIDINNDITITNGTLDANSNNLNIGGSWDNNSVFTANNSLVTFDSADTGETIEAGGSSFYDIEFDSSGGGWTIQTNNLTTSNDFTITDCAGTSGFIVEANRTITVNGQYSTLESDSATTWNSSTTLNLTKTGGGTYTINSKSAGEDTYVTLEVGADTDIRMWDSQATTHTVNASGSLYSMDHAGTNGDLYIWGDYYVPADATDYWCYATDFDSTDLSGGSERQVDVRLGSSANVTCGSGETLDIEGASGNETVVSRNGSGTYGIDINDGIINAEYYSIEYIDAAGLNISGSSVTIGKLLNGDFDNSGGSGSSDTFITIAGVSIDNNPAFEIPNVNFDDTNGAADYNVTATGTASSFINFSSSTGTFDGETNDSDPDGDPGYLVWDDSAGASVSIAGIAYTDDDELTTVPDDTSVKLVVDGDDVLKSYTQGTTSGSFTFSGVSVDVGSILTFFFDGETFDGSCVTISDGTDINNLRIYQDHVITGHAADATLSIAQMAIYDDDDDDDINFDAEDLATDTLITDTTADVFIPTSFTFQPGGNLESGSNGAGGLDIRGNFNLVSSEVIRVIGGWDNQGTFTPSDSTVKFAATSGSPAIDTNGVSFYDLEFIGSTTYTLASSMTVDNSIEITSGTLNTSTYTLTATPTLTINGGALSASNGNIDADSDVTISSGTLTAPASGKSFTIAGNYSNSGGTFISGTGKVTFNKSGTQTIDAGGTGNNNKDFTDLEKSGSGTLQLVTSDLEVDGTLTVPVSITLDLNARSLVLGTLDNSGIVRMLGSEPTVTISTMETVTGEVVYVGDGDETPEAFIIKDFGSLDYYDLTINDANTTKDTFRTNANLSVNGDLEVLDGALDISFNGNTLTAAAGFTIDGGTVTATDGNVDANAGLTLTSGGLVAPDSTQFFRVAGSLTLSGTFTNSSGLIELDAGSGTPTISATGGDFYDIEFDATGITHTLNSAITATNDFTITNGTLDTGTNYAIIVGGNWVNSDEFVSNTSLVTFNKASGTQTIDAGGTASTTKDFQHLTKSGSGTLQLINTGLEVDGTFTLSSGLLLDLNGQNLTVGTMDNGGTIELHGDETVGITTMDIVKGLVKYVGNGDDTQDTRDISGFGTSQYYNLTINDANATKDIFQTTEDTSVAGAFEIDGGTLTTTSYNFDVDSTFDVTSGAFTAPGTSKTLTVGDDFTVAGTFTANSGEVVLDNNSNDATLDVPAGGIIFDDFTCNTASKVLNFTASDTFTISGALTLNGSSSLTRIDLNSTTPDTVWNLILNGTHSVSYVDVQDSNISGTATLPVNPVGSYDSGNNANWFPVGPGGDANALRSGQDRHTLYDGSDYWLFYINEDKDVKYETSSDGIDWSAAAVSVAAGDFTSLGVWEDGTNVYCVYTDGASLFEKQIPISTGTPGTEREVISDLMMEWGTVSSVTSTFGTVNLINDYGSSMVVVASSSYVYTDDPTVTRIQNADDTSFDVRVQNAGGTGPATQTVYYLVAKATSSGTQIPGTSNYIEAQTYSSTVTDTASSWVGEQQTYQNTYTNPVVLGQVMTQADSSWSVFWDWDNATRANPPTASAIYTGKHVGEDTDDTREDETVGLIVIEDSRSTINGIAYEANLTTTGAIDAITDLSGGAAWDFTSAFSSTPETGVVSLAGMSGGNGRMSLIYGTSSFSTTQINLGCDEDSIADADRGGNTETLAYCVFEDAGGYYGGDINHPQIIKDSANYFWIKWENSNNDTFIVRSQSVSDESTWDPHYITNSSTDTTDYGHSQIVPLASGNIMCIYQDGNTLYSKIFSDPASQGSATEIVIDCASSGASSWDEQHYFSVVSDISGTDYLVYLIYEDSSTGYIEHVIYDSDSAAWGSAVSVSNSGSCASPSLFYDETYGTIYATWINSSSVKYKRLEGPDWPQSEETLISGLSTPAFLNSAYADESTIGLTWKEGTGASAFLSFGTITLMATIVDISQFYALGFDTQVKLIWKTESEIDNAGFNIYRSQDPDDGFTKINASLIAGLGTSVAGQSYEYNDSSVTAGLEYYYILESVETNGLARKFGPVVAHPGLDSDTDGMSDDYEYYYGLDAGVDDAANDPDNDGATNLAEYQNATDPYSSTDALLSWEATTPGAAGITVISSTDSSITLELVTNEFDAEDKVVGVDTYHAISFSEYAHSYNDDEGKPMVPFKGMLLTMRDKTPLTLEVLESEKTSLTGYNIYPVPQRVLTVASGTTYLQTQFYKDSVTYSADALYPVELVELDYSSLLRDQQVVRVEFHPLQFNPVTGEVEFYNRLRVRLTTQAAETAAAADSGGSGISQGVVSALKIQVNEDGIYRLTYSQLDGEGVDVNNINPTTFGIYNQGSEIPIYVYGENDAVFNTGDYIEFYGQKSTTRYANNNIYWLVFSQGPGVRMEDKSSSGGSTPVSFLYTHHHENNEWYWSEMEGADDPWYLYPPVKVNTDEEFDIVLEDVVDSQQSSLLSCAFRGFNTMDYPYYHLRIFMNDHLVGELTWEEEIDNSFQLQMPSYWLTEGTNTIKIEHALDDAVYPNSWVFIDWFDISYWRELKASSDYLEISAQGVGDYTYVVSNFSDSDIRVYDISSPGNVKRISDATITADGLTYSATFNDTSLAAAKYAVVSTTAVKSPTGFVADIVSSLRTTSNQADYIIITLDDFYDEILPLSNYRQNQGLNVIVAKLTDVYDEFNYGITSPNAIKYFLQYAYNNWQKPAPTYVLLVGDATYDYRDDELYGFVDYMPTYFVYNTDFGETATDNWFVCFGGETDIMPEMLIGRFPARSGDEVEIMVNKTIAFEAVSLDTDWLENMLFVADDEATFEAIGNELSHSNMIGADYTAQKIYLGSYSTAAECRTDIVSKINDGASMLTYIGHGGIDIWADEQIFRTEDVDSLSNQGKYPVILNLNCTTGYFHYPMYYECLAEEFLRGLDKGAVAVFAPSGVSLPEQQRILAEGLYDSIFKQKTRILGSAVETAKLYLFQEAATSSSDVLETFNLFGDPALILRQEAITLSTEPTTPDVYEFENVAPQSLFALGLSSDASRTYPSFVFDNIAEISQTAGAAPELVPTSTSSAKQLSPVINRIASSQEVELVTEDEQHRQVKNKIVHLGPVSSLDISRISQPKGTDVPTEKDKAIVGRKTQKQKIGFWEGLRRAIAGFFSRLFPEK